MYSRGGYWLLKTKMDSATSYYFINENFSTGKTYNTEPIIFSTELNGLKQAIVLSKSNVFGLRNVFF
jgi:hypothetical protein